MRRARLILLLGLGLALLLGGVPFGERGGFAEAQVWRPESRKRKRPAPPPKKKPEPARKKPAPAKKKPAPPPADDDELDEELLEEGDEPSPGADADPFAEDDDDDDDDDDDEVLESSDTADGDASLEGGTLRLEDDLDTGADVTFTDADLTTAKTGGDGKGVTRLETLAMAYLRLGMDSVHDAVPTAPTGVKAVGEDTLSFRSHARAEGTGRFGKRVKVKVAGRANADLSLDSDTNIGVQRYEAEVWDTYADIYWPSVDVRFGKQIVAWGVSDLLSPNDVVNARDLRRGFLDRPDELRLPLLALSTTVYDGPFSLQALWIPVAPTNRFELLQGDYALLGPNAATPVERRVGAIVSTLADDPMLGLQVRPILDLGAAPDNGLETGELGAKLALRFKKLDLAGYFLWGHERNPRIQIHPDLAMVFVDTPPEMLTPELVAGTISQLAMMGQPAVGVDYPRRIHAGGSIATRLEPFGVKLEGGYDLEANTIVVPPGAGPLLSQSMALPQGQVTASIDYDRGTSLTIILEASHLRVFDVPTDRDVFQYDHDRLNLVAGRFEWNPRRGPVTLRFLGIADLSSPSYAVRPAVRLSGNDNVSLEIAATLFGGPAGSYGGVADRNDEILLTAQYGL